MLTQNGPTLYHLAVGLDIIDYLKAVGGSLQVWGCIFASGVGNLVEINDVEKHKGILIHYVMSAVREGV